MMLRRTGSQRDTGLDRRIPGSYTGHMSETRDKRGRTDLDLFVLALIDSRISTPYEFQKVAGLSPGATIPALQILLDAGFQDHLGCFRPYDGRVLVV